jgi:hypothetical protein
MILVTNRAAENLSFITDSTSIARLAYPIAADLRTLIPPLIRIMKIMIPVWILSYYAPYKLSPSSLFRNECGSSFPNTRD